MPESINYCAHLQLPVQLGAALLPHTTVALVVRVSNHMQRQSCCCHQLIYKRCAGDLLPTLDCIQLLPHLLLLLLLL
jgi:hypothetical protein